MDRKSLFPEWDQWADMCENADYYGEAMNDEEIASARSECVTQLKDAEGELLWPPRYFFQEDLPFEMIPTENLTVDELEESSTRGNLTSLGQGENDGLRELRERACDIVEAQKYQNELEQSIRDMRVASPRRISAEWRLKMLMAWALMMGLPLVGATSHAEETANAMSTFVWTCGCVYAMYILVSAMARSMNGLTDAITVCMKALTVVFGQAIVHFTQGGVVLMTTISGSINQVTNSFTLLMTTANGAIPNLLEEITDAVRWWKVSLLVKGIADFARAFADLAYLPMRWLFGGWNRERLCNQGWLPESFRPQQANKYGVLLSCVLATVMFVLVPLWGFARSYKAFEPVMRLLEKLPYVTWLMEWVEKYMAGETDTETIPTGVRKFMDGEEVPVQQYWKQYKWQPGMADLGTCDLSRCAKGVCEEGCCCRCHIEEEREDCFDDIDAGDHKESKGGLGSRVRRSADRFVNDFEKPLRESKEDREARNKAYAQYFEKGGVQSTRMQFDQETALSDEAGPSEEDKADMPIQRDKTNFKTLIDEKIVCAREKGKELVVIEDVTEESEPLWGAKADQWEVKNQAFGANTWNYGQTAQRARQAFYTTMKAAGYDQYVAWIVQYGPKIVGGILGMVIGLGAFYTMQYAARTGKSFFAGDAEVKPEGNHNKSRWTAKQRVHRERRRRGEHVVSGSQEQDIDYYDALEEQKERDYEEYERGQREAERIDQEEERAARKGRWEGEGMPRKMEELKMKHFPIRVDPQVVAKRARAIRRAKTEEKSYSRREYDNLLKRETEAIEKLKDESLLGRHKLLWAPLAQKVFKCYHGDVVTSSSTVVCDKMVVPLHSHVDGAPVSFANASTSIKVRGEVIPIAEDLGVYFHHGAVKPALGWKMRAPENEMAMIIGYNAPEQVEPGFSVGFCSTDGLYNAGTAEGDCAGPVVAIKDGNLIGFHIGGGTKANKFVPMTAEIAKMLQASGPVLNSMLFQ